MGQDLESILVLSGYLAGLPPDVNRRFLEIGAGVGLVSIVAATFGHQITMTEYNSDAAKIFFRFQRAQLANLNLNLHFGANLPIFKYRTFCSPQCGDALSAPITKTQLGIGLTSVNTN